MSELKACPHDTVLRRIDDDTFGTVCLKCGVVTRTWVDPNRRAAPEPVGVEWHDGPSPVWWFCEIAGYEATVRRFESAPNFIAWITRGASWMWPCVPASETFPTAEAARAECARRLTLLCEATKTENPHE